MHKKQKKRIPFLILLFYHQMTIMKYLKQLTVNAVNIALAIKEGLRWFF